MTVRLLARCVRGLEWVAAAEVAGLPAVTGLALAPREVSFQLPVPVAGLAGLRSVDDVFVETGVVPGAGTTREVPAWLARQLVGLDWRRGLGAVRAVRPVPDQFGFDVVASLDGDRRYHRFDVEHAIGPALAPVIGGRFLPRPPGGRPAGGEPDLTVRVRLRGPEALAALRLARRPLHRRDYKQDTGAGTLHPPVAAGLARLAAPGAGEPVLDPFCGDGTIVIETALSYPAARVTGGDIDPDRVANARRNAARAGLTLALARADAGLLTAGSDLAGAVVTNPPWNLTVRAGGRLGGSLDPFWRRLPELTTDRGRVCLVADAGLDAAARLERLGYRIVLGNPIRLAGRVSQLVLGAPAGRAGTVPAELRAWRDRALRAGVITDEWS